MFHGKESEWSYDGYIQKVAQGTTDKTEMKREERQIDERPVRAVIDGRAGFVISIQLNSIQYSHHRDRDRKGRRR